MVAGHWRAACGLADVPWSPWMGEHGDQPIPAALLRPDARPRARASLSGEPRDQPFGEFDRLVLSAIVQCSWRRPEVGQFERSLLIREKPGPIGLRLHTHI